MHARGHGRRRGRRGSSRDARAIEWSGQACGPAVGEMCAARPEGCRARASAAPGGGFRGVARGAGGRYEGVGGDVAGRGGRKPWPGGANARGVRVRKFLSFIGEPPARSSDEASLPGAIACAVRGQLFAWGCRRIHGRPARHGHAAPARVRDDLRHRPRSCGARRCRAASERGIGVGRGGLAGARERTDRAGESWVTRFRGAVGGWLASLPRPVQQGRDVSAVWRSCRSMPSERERSRSRSDEPFLGQRFVS